MFQDGTSSTEHSTWKPVYVYIANMTAIPVQLPKFTLLAYASVAPTCIIRAIRDEPNMLEGRGTIPTQGDNFYSDPIVTSVFYKTAE